MVSGSRLDFRMARILTHTIHLTKVCSSAPASVLLLPGIPLRVIVATMMGPYAMSATAATIGRLLLVATTRMASTSTTRAASVLRTTAAVVGAVGRSVAFKNKSS